MKQLGHLPLAIEQAGAYIYAHQLPLGEYLPKYQSSFQAVMNKRPRGLGTYVDTVYTTWMISLNAIKAQSTAAAQLLILYGFLSNDVSDDLMLHGDLIADQGDFIHYQIQNILS